MTQRKHDDLPSVVITGASTGIGEACALELDRRHFRVFAGVRSEDDGRRLAAKASGRLTPVLIDVTEEGTIAAAAELIRDAVGDRGLAGLVNNAGIVVAAPLELVPIEALREQLEVNVVGQIAVTQPMIPLLRVGRGRIVNIGSLNGRIAAPYVGPYSASKYALEALTDALRIELRRWGIPASIVEPGDVKTPIWEKSRAASDRIAEGVSDEQFALYGADIAAVRKLTEHIARTAMPPERVVRAVVRALCARRPKTRYVVGPWARIGCLTFRFLPDRIRDWIIRRAMGLR